MKNKKVKHAIIIAATIIIIGLMQSWIMGSYLIKANHKILPKPNFENYQNVEFTTSDKIKISGWFVDLKDSKITCILLHGFRGNKFEMVERANFLIRNGISVLLIDFRANGESGGDYTTSGFKEVNEVASAVTFVKNKKKDKIIIIGNSMGAAALSMSRVDNYVDGMVFEQMYSNLETAIKNRMADALGDWSRNLSPLLTIQMKIRFGFSVDEVAPIGFVNEIKCQKLFMVGDKDSKTTYDESKRIFEAAGIKKDLVIFEGAKHQDLYRFDKDKYEKSILHFIEYFN
jgi:uncharacterized protein